LQLKASAEKFPGGWWEQRKKDRKQQKRPINGTINPFLEGANEKNTPKNSKNGRKIALLNLYLIYLYHVWKSRRRGSTASLLTRMVAAHW